ncbi:hypothetical protein [Hydrocarboniphaga sp.]|uniref:hypothetical protein n=1 Tax=Hydrocarboniphaga sp. TaxID=2033016 RepID=UPI003D0A39A9
MADAALRAQVLATAPLSGPDWVRDAASIVLVIGSCLALDSLGLLWTQVLAGVLAWALLLLLLHRQTPAWRLTLVIATAFALLAEALFSLGWGLYEYRLQNIPAYVPPAHTLLFMLGAGVARRVPQRVITPLLLAFAAGAMLLTLSAISSFDGLLLAILLLVVRYGRQRRIYVMMLLIALALELVGTSVGAWAWLPHAPGLALSLHSPPLLAGVFYSLFDVYIMASARHLHRRQAALSAPATS